MRRIDSPGGGCPDASARTRPAPAVEASQPASAAARARGNRVGVGIGRGAATTTATGRHQSITKPGGALVDDERKNPSRDWTTGGGGAGGPAVRCSSPSRAAPTCRQGHGHAPPPRVPSGALPDAWVTGTGLSMCCCAPTGRRRRPRSLGQRVRTACGPRPDVGRRVPAALWSAGHLSPSLT